MNYSIGLGQLPHAHASFPDGVVQGGARCSVGLHQSLPRQPPLLRQHAVVANLLGGGPRCSVRPSAVFRLQPPRTVVSSACVRASAG